MNEMKPGQEDAVALSYEAEVFGSRVHDVLHMLDQIEQQEDLTRESRDISERLRHAVRDTAGLMGRYKLYRAPRG